ncbi:MAG: beta-1,6-N-acetylglucosaminyltransferase [Burkholderiales bacterium]|nr:beta-1,6-N-acetylglucosaminyltransferase [Burkholderiales bacterium]
MIAYLILTHRYPNQFKRLFNAIYHPDNFYLVHIDSKSSHELHDEIKEFLMKYNNAQILVSENTLWGGYSLVNAELRGIKHLLNQNKDWKFFINLSGQDFPLKSQEYIHNFLLNHIDTDFLKVMNQKEFRADTMHRIENYVTEVDDEIISEPVVKRQFLNDVIPYIGNQWMILSRKFCEFITYSPEVERFKQFYEHTLIADEGFFQTVIMNTTYKSTIVNNDKRAIDWIPMGTIKLRPRDFTIKDEAFLIGTDNLFARKFDETLDMNILDVLDKHIAQK